MAIDASPIPELTAEEKLRFWEKVDLRPDGIWAWAGAKNTRHYGYCTIRKRTYLAHRVAWFIANGPIPPGQFVLHKNDVTPETCDVNPKNLFLGTADDNNKDKAEKGRASRLVGEAHPMSKASDVDRERIRKLHHKHQLSFHDLADVYGLSVPTISRIVSAGQESAVGTEDGPSRVAAQPSLT